jgi:2-amino-4-hydroxy-6-hydroxymethyldihydropteridine diphosphokinase
LEQASGRVRDPARPYGPRSLDVDVIAVWGSDGTPILLGSADQDASPEALTLPHPRAHLRAFVLRPWLDLDPDAELPGHGRVAELLQTPAVAADLPDVRLCPTLTLT